MSEDPLAFDYSKLSPEDQKVIRAFLATNDFKTRSPGDDESAMPPAPQPVNQEQELDLEDEMISVFAGEVEGDLAVLRGGLEQVERDEDVRSPGFLTLQQVAHKIRGSAGMIGCEVMATIAHRIELVVHQIRAGKTDLHTGLYGLAQAVGALEMTLASVVTDKQEDVQPLLGLEQDFATLNISLEEPGEEASGTSAGANPIGVHLAPGNDPSPVILSDPSPVILSEAKNLTRHTEILRGVYPRAERRAQNDRQDRPDSGEFEQIIRHSERLIEQQTTLEDARRQVTEAFQELQTAQARLRRLEAFFSSLFLSAAASGSEAGGAGEGAIPASSLVARILREAAQRTGRAYQFETNIPALLLEDATRWDELEMDRFSETNLLVYALNEAISDIATANAQLQRALAHLDQALGQQIATTQQLHAGVTRHFPQATKQVRGLLARAWEQQVIIPFTQVLRIDERRQDDYDQFYMLNDLLGFPPAGATDSLTTSTTIAIQPVLRLSLVLDPEPSALERLRRGSEGEGMETGTQAARQVGVQVDEVIGQVELLARQPPAPLQRPGIVGMAIDSAGNVLLVLDLPELVWREQTPAEPQGQKHIVSEQREAYQVAHQTTRARPKILVVDDSVTIRRTIRQTLSQKDYTIVEAGNGREALEKIEEESPDLLLLDLEMPRMNGYEVMKVLRTRALLPGLKIALLTSRTSSKHKQRAQELGVHKYLTKPCAENTLLETVAALLE